MFIKARRNRSAMAFLDLDGVHAAFISFLETELKLTGPWPAPKYSSLNLYGGGSLSTMVFPFEAFHGIKMKKNLAVTQIEMCGYSEFRGGLKGCVNFRMADGCEVASASGLFVPGLHAELSLIIEKADPSITRAAPSWLEVVQQVVRVVEGAQSDDANAGSRTRLLHIAREILDGLEDGSVR